MLKILFALLCFLAGGKSEAEVDFNAILNRFKGAQVGFLAISSKNHEVIGERNSNLLLNPASNVKLVTTLAALEILHPEYQFKTEYYASGEIREGVLNGDLVVKGYGDPSITNERLQGVARYLKLMGIQSIAGSLILDDSYFGGENQASGWEREKNSSKLYTAPIGALSLNRNIVTLFVRPGRLGQPAIVSADPAVDYFQFTGSIKTASRRNRPAIGTRNTGEHMVFNLGGTIAVNSNVLFARKKVYHAKTYFEAVFSHFLKQEGISIKHSIRPSLSHFDPKEARLLWTDKSPMLSQIVGDTNKSSSNFMAEMLVKAIAGKVSTPAKFETGLQEMSKFLETKVGFKKGSYKLANGSGLGADNRFSARQFVTLLEYGKKKFEVSSEFMASLGVAGTQGTMRKRMKQEPTLRSVRAKTGTLTGVSSLSGYVGTQGDDDVIFSILVQGRPNVVCKARWLEDRIGNFLAKLHTDTEPCLSSEDTIEAEEGGDEDLEELSGG